MTAPVAAATETPDEPASPATPAEPEPPRRADPQVLARLVVPLTPERQEELAALATDALLDHNPNHSAKVTFSKGQKVGAVVTAAVLLILAIPFPVFVARLLGGFFTLIYAGTVIYKTLCVSRGIKAEHIVRITDAEALGVADADLPVYTVLVPAYKEPEVIPALMENLAALDYPADKLEILVLLEADDDETLQAVGLADPPSSFRVVVVPPAEVTTKPRACNVGLALATGELVTIYDAEDRPEPLQLRRAAVAFARAEPTVAVLQARLAYFNGEQNIITRWFTAEYLTWFRHLLPGMSAIGAPIPLGGTSNHTRTALLRQVGGWDAYNVTEDADLGIRLARLGYTTEVLDSDTLEEANSDFVNWVKQRSRWYKGYLQTWLVHMRSPRALKRETGWSGVLGVNLFIGGTPLLAMLNPVFWTLTIIWFGLKPPIIEKAFSSPVYYVALLLWLIGNFTMIYTGVISIRAARRPELIVPTLLVPGYWVMMALAAVKAGVQLVRDPSYWEKTTHGLDSATVAAAEAAPVRTPAPVAAVAEPEAVPVAEEVVVVAAAETAAAPAKRGRSFAASAAAKVAAAREARAAEAAAKAEREAAAAQARAEQRAAEAAAQAEREAAQAKQRAAAAAAQAEREAAAAEAAARAEQQAADAATKADREAALAEQRVAETERAAAEAKKRSAAEKARAEREALVIAESAEVAEQRRRAEVLASLDFDAEQAEAEPDVPAAPAAPAAVRPRELAGVGGRTSALERLAAARDASGQPLPRRTPPATSDRSSALERLAAARDAARPRD